MDMNFSPRPHRRRSGYHAAAGLTLGLALVVGGASWPGPVASTVSAQALNPCALLLDDEIKPLAEKTSVAAGVSQSPTFFGDATCRYAWGDGVDRYKLVVAVIEPSRMFPGLTPDQVKQRLLGSVRAGTQDAVIPEIGDAAVFKPDSSVYASATAFVKGRMLQVQLDGLGALDKKDQVIGLLKSAASRL
jgi:hypothetical protein